MNFLESYFNVSAEGHIVISGAQGSEFAKRVANDFNPIHDSEAKRFCVPGDLLFAIALDRYGLYQRMSFRFLDLVGAQVPLHYPALGELSTQGKAKLDCVVHNHREKPVLAVSGEGAASSNRTQIEQLLRKYVAFSGHNFPHILVPLMKKHGVMINPKRPLVIYESMSFELQDVDFENVEIELGETRLEVSGKRGDAILEFVIYGDAQRIGSGEKKLVLSGLREYEDAGIDAMRAEYLERKTR